MSYQQIWNDYYEEIKGVPFYLDAKEAACLKQLRGRIKWYVETKGFTDIEDDWLDQRLKGFLEKITDNYVLQNLTPSICLRQFNILLAQMEGKKIKNHEQTYHTKVNEYTPEQIAELQRIRNGYDRLKNEAPRTRGEQTRMVVRGDETTGPTPNVMVESLAQKIGKH